MTVRELVEYFGYSRRSWRNCLAIKDFLNKNEIELSSDLSQEWFDAEMEMRHKTVATTKVPEDAVKRVFSMAAANHKPVFVKRNDTVEHAITLMQLHDYSQLPVVGSNERTVVGHISSFSLDKSGDQKTCGGLTIKVIPTAVENWHVSAETADTGENGTDNGDGTWSATYAAGATGSSTINVTYAEDKAMMCIGL